MGEKSAKKWHEKRFSEYQNVSARWVWERYNDECHRAIKKNDSLAKVYRIWYSYKETPATNENAHSQGNARSITYADLPYPTSFDSDSRNIPVANGNWKREQKGRSTKGQPSHMALGNTPSFFVNTRR